MTKEQVYDSEIAPLMTKIIAACKKHKISLVADFGLDEDLRATTLLLLEEYEPSEQQLKAGKILWPKTFVAGLGITTTEGK